MNSETLLHSTLMISISSKSLTPSEIYSTLFTERELLTELILNRYSKKYTVVICQSSGPMGKRIEIRVEKLSNLLTIAQQISPLCLSRIKGEVTQLAWQQMMAKPEMW